MLKPLNQKIVLWKTWRLYINNSNNKYSKPYMLLACLQK